MSYSLLAMIGQRLSRNLASCDAAAVGERGDKKRVDGRVLLELIQDLVDAFIDERHGADLDADHLLCRRLTLDGLCRGGDGPRCSGVKEISSVHGCLSR